MCWTSIVTGGKLLGNLHGYTQLPECHNFAEVIPSIIVAVYGKRQGDDLVYRRRIKHSCDGGVGDGHHERGTHSGRLF